MSIVGAPSSGAFQPPLKHVWAGSASPLNATGRYVPPQDLVHHLASSQEETSCCYSAPLLLFCA
ncbi:hypothetical protein L0F63_002374 [Massospora cicadina]|nr:hypothetical protein L0F63_002374 [Massospora cicadina]